MNEPNHGSSFWLGNVLLGVSLVMLIFLGSLWEAIGALAMVLWMVLAGVGMYLVTRDKGPTSKLPD
jgi:purine-cytosine permease-like protein